MKLRVRWDLVVDAAGILGLALIAVGLWWIYPPASLIYAGLAIVFVCWLVAKWVL